MPNVQHWNDNFLFSLNEHALLSSPFYSLCYLLFSVLMIKITADGK